MRVLLALLMMTATAHADTMIGFRGRDKLFDQAAFEQYARKHKMTPVVLDAEAIGPAVKIIASGETYALYGFSKGAESVKQVMRKVEQQGLNKPTRILTIGAWHTTDVNFHRHGVKFDNYFDASGSGQRSPSSSHDQYGLPC